MGGIHVTKTYGGGEDARNACMTLGTFSTGMIANGEVSPELAKQAGVMEMITQVYHLAPNLVMACGNGVVDSFQFWPGERPGESVCSYRRYTSRLPQSPEDRLALATGVAGVMQVLCGEDLDQCVRMQVSGRR